MVINTKHVLQPFHAGMKQEETQIVLVIGNRVLEREGAYFSCQSTIGQTGYKEC